MSNVIFTEKAWEEYCYGNGDGSEFHEKYMLR